MSSRAIGGSSSSWRFGRLFAFILSLALLFVTGGAWAAADKYWIAENGAGNWGDANWATSTDGVGSTFDSGKTALFHQPLNNIDLFGESFTAWTLRPKSGEYSTDNRCVVNICNTSETEATLTFKDFGDNAEDLRNMVVTFGGSKSTGKVKVYGDANSANSRYSFVLDHDSHLVFAANSEYTESNALASYIGKTAGTSNSVTVEDGASVKMKGKLHIAASGTLTVNGGMFEVADDMYIADSGSGTLTVNGGTFELANNKWLRLYKNGVINLNGGTFKTQHIQYQSGAKVNINGGTFQANAASKDGLIQNGTTVTVNGGTINSGNFDITIPAALGVSGNTGGLTFTGGSTITLSNGSVNYSGKTYVMPGTTLSVYQFDASNNILNNGLVVAGVPEVGQKILTLTRGEGYTFEHGDSAWTAGKRPLCPVAPEAEFELDETKTSIVVKSVGSVLPGWYIGPADGSLSDAANWSDGVVPTSGNPVIFCTHGARLSVGETFRADTITIPSSSQIVTIGDGDLQVGTLTNASKLAIAEGASLTVENDIVVSANYGVFLYGNEGTVTVGGKARAYHPGSSGISTYQYQTVTANTKPIRVCGIAYDNSGYGLYMHLDSANKTKGMWIVGSDGISFPAARNAEYSRVYTQGAQVTIYSSANWTLGTKAGTSTDGEMFVRDSGSMITLDTSDFVDSTIRRTITLNGRIHAWNNGSITVSGCGTVVVDTTANLGSDENKSNTRFDDGSTLYIKDTATLQVNAGKKILGEGTISLGAGTTLALDSGALGTVGDLEFTPSIPGLVLPATGTATIRIDGARLKSGDHEIATVASGASVNVALNPDSAAIDGRKATLRVDEKGKLILSIQPGGLTVIIR